MGDEGRGFSYAVKIPGEGQDIGESEEFFSGDPILEMDLFINFDDRDLPRIGRRWLRMLVCEPLVTKVRVHPNCCSSWEAAEYFTNEGESDISNATGISIGDLYHEINRVRKSHRLCDGDRWALAHGFGPMSCTFHSTIKVRSDDPVATYYLYRYAKSGVNETSRGEVNQAEKHDVGKRPSSTQDSTEPPGLDDVPSDPEEDLAEPVHGYDNAKEIGKHR